MLQNTAKEQQECACTLLLERVQTGEHERAC